MVLRGQKAHNNAQMKRRHDQMNVVGTVESYKNPINLYNTFKVTHNKVTLKNGTTPNELLDCFNSLNEVKHEVAEKVKNAL